MVKRKELVIRLLNSRFIDLKFNEAIHYYYDIYKYKQLF